ncbi:MAG: hypothetical protein V3V34_08445 [Kiloniellales bacterium]
MSGCPSNLRRRCAFVLIFATAAVAGPWLSPAAGQEAEDPTAYQPPAGQPLMLAPPTVLLPQAGGQTDAEPESTPDVEGIEVSRLAEMDPESIGILDPERGGLGSDLWRGTERRVVEQLLPRLPGMMHSAGMRNLARRLLLSNAAAPTDRPDAAPSHRVNLLALRIDRLAAMGDYPGLSGLLQVVPLRYDDEPVARARVEALLLQGRTAEACTEVRPGVAAHQGNPYWRKALVFCQILSGEAAEASLGVALLREEGEQQDQAFFQLADSLTGLSGGALSAWPNSALHFAMLQAVGQPLPDEMLDQLSPGLLVSLANAPANGLEQRAQAAERAVSFGLLRPDELADIYDSYGFSAAQLANAISSAETLSGPERRALLFQAAWGQTVPSARAEIVNVALDEARAQGAYQLAVRLYMPLIADFPLKPELAWFAGAAGRALYATGRFEQAAAWLTLARQEALINAQAAMAVSALWPYSRLASGVATAWEGNLTVWAESRSDLADMEIARQQLLLRAAFQALGESDPMIWADLVGIEPAVAAEGAAPDTALVYALSEASQFGRLGETVLLALLALGEAGPASSHPLVLHEVLAALTRVDLVAEARMLAIEAAVANGI